MKTRRILLYIILVLLILIFLASAFCLGRYFLDSKRQSDRYNELASLVEQHRQEATLPPATSPTVPESTVPEETQGPSILPEYENLYEINPDLIGWLKIDGTVIDYPVMQTPDAPNYYLRRNFDQDTNAHGCLYAAEWCDIAAPSDNITIYGHHMKDGSMFADLFKYLKKTFWEEHGSLRFDTLTEHHTYRIFAVFRTTASKGEGFAYHRFVDAADEADFDRFVDRCKELSVYDTGITPAYGEKIICLSTCEYTRQNGRLVVAAVRID